MRDQLYWVAELETERIEARDFVALPEYSATNPTGVTIGKRWRCLLGAHALDWIAKGGQPRWIIKEYVAVDDPKMAAVKQTRPIIIVRPRDKDLKE